MSKERFKKTDTAELENTIAIIVCFIMLGLPIAYFIQLTNVFELSNVALGEMVLEFGAVLLLILDIMYLKQRENRYFSLFGLFVVIYSISVVISTLFAKDPALAISGNSFTKEGCIAILSYLILLYNSAIIYSEKNRVKIIRCLILFGVIQLVVGILQAVFQAPFLIDEISQEHIENKRALGTILNPNPYGSVMAFLSGLEYGMFYYATDKKKKILHAVLSAGFTYAVFLSGTRGAWVGLAGAAFLGSVLILIVERKNGEVLNTLKKLGCVLMLVIIAVVIFVTASSDTAKDVVSRSDSDIENSNLGEDRLVIWKNSFDAYFFEHPVIGVGISNVKTMIRAVEHEYTVELIYAKDAHNRYLNILCTQGLVGFISYVILIGYVMYQLFVGMIKKRKMKELFPFFVAIVGWLIADLFSVCNVYMEPYLFILLGLSVSRKETMCILGMKNKRMPYENKNLNNN